MKTKGTCPKEMVWGGEEIEALQVGSLPRARHLPKAWLLRFPQVRKIQASLCGHRLFAPYPDLMMLLIWFLNSGFAVLWAGAGVC